MVSSYFNKSSSVQSLFLRLQFIYVSPTDISIVFYIEAISVQLISAAFLIYIHISVFIVLNRMQRTKNVNPFVFICTVSRKIVRLPSGRILLHELSARVLHYGGKILLKLCVNFR